MNLAVLTDAAQPTRAKSYPERNPLGAGKAPRSTVEFDHVNVDFGRGASSHHAVEDASLHIPAGQFVCLLGPSGCGKSTLLNCVAGFIRPVSGRVTIEDRDAGGPGSDRGMVFQSHSLFPWKTVKDNVAFGPRMAGRDAAESQRIAREFLAMVGLSAFENRYPATLSGGMQQRVGIARALANYPSVLLMDEPFGALDAQTRASMQENLLEIWGAFGNTVIFVTHDIDEAVFLADRIVVMSAAPGRLIADIKVDMPRPRDPEISTTAEFMSIKKRCLKLIRQEALRGAEQRDDSA